nr:Flp pilus assembly protein CpaB [Rhodospirillales bacterium]
MNKSFLMMLAFVFAGSAAWIANQWIESQTNMKNGNNNTVAVVVAATQIPLGTRIEAVHIKLLEWPNHSVPEEAFTEILPVIGKVSQRSFISNEILLKPQISEHLGGSTLSALITEGMRAMSVRVDDVVGVAGFILPGNKVDIIHAKSTQKGQNTYTLLHNIKVLAIDQAASTDQEKPSVVRALTLEVTPRQSEQLVKAMKSGSLQFTLRNPLDDMTLIETKKPTKPSIKKIRHAVIDPSITILHWNSNTVKKCKAKVC